LTQQLIFTCATCSKIYTLKDTYNKHITSCPSSDVVKKLKTDLNSVQTELLTTKTILSEKEQCILKLEAQLKEFQTQLSDIAKAATSKSTSTTTINTINRNQTINNLLPITDSHLKEQAQFLTIDHIKKGAEGYAEYATEFPLKDRIACTDVSRRIIKYKDDKGMLQTDPEMVNLSKQLFSSITEKNMELITDYISELTNGLTSSSTESKDLSEDEAKQDYNISSSIVDNITEIVKFKFKIKEIGNGSQNDVVKEFVRAVCKRAKPSST